MLNSPWEPHFCSAIAFVYIRRQAYHAVNRFETQKRVFALVSENEPGNTNVYILNERETTVFNLFHGVVCLCKEWTVFSQFCQEKRCFFKLF